MYGVIVVLILIVSILLILVVLAQNPKGGGLSSQFGGGGSSQLMGVKKTGDLLEKLTWGFACALLIFSVLTSFFQEENATQEYTSPNLEGVQNEAPAPALNLGTEDLQINESLPGTDSAE